GKEDCASLRIRGFKPIGKPEALTNQIQRKKVTDPKLGSLEFSANDIKANQDGDYTSEGNAKLLRKDSDGSTVTVSAPSIAYTTKGNITMRGPSKIEKIRSEDSHDLIKIPETR